MGRGDGNATLKWKKNEQRWMAIAGGGPEGTPDQETKGLQASPCPQVTVSHPDLLSAQTQGGGGVEDPKTCSLGKVSQREG